MKPMHILMLASIALTAPAISHAQVAGTTLLGVSVAEMREVAKGWGVKRTEGHPKGTKIETGQNASIESGGTW